MTVLAYTVLVFLVAQIGVTESKPTNPEDNVLSTSIGILVKIDPETGTNRSLHREDIEKFGKDENHHLLLYLDDGSSPLGMEVMQGSVWSRDSIVVVRRGQNRMRIPNGLGENCFLHGSVLEHEGAVNINRCGRLTGDIHIPGHHYEIEEHDLPEGEENLSHTKFKVTKRLSPKEEMDMEEEYEEETYKAIEKEAEREVERELVEENSNGTLRRKRQILSITIELAAFLDQNYVDYLYYERYLDTEAKIKNWIIAKWNSVQGVYNDVNKIGARVKIALKKIEIWWENPPGYPNNEVEVSPRLHWFCHNTPEGANYDQKVLYTKGVGSHALGLAYVGSVCNALSKCYLVKSPSQRVRVELHEMGHNIGFRHDPDIGGCNLAPGGGFMGWSDTYKYLPCYKRKLQANLRLRSYDCLFERNVYGDGNIAQSPLPTTTGSYYHVGC